MMKRLTERNSSGNGYFPECFKEPCLGLGCKKNDCVFINQVCNRLADYEDTGLLPEEIKSLQAEWSVNLIALENYRELTQTDKSDWISVKDKTPKSGAVLATDGKIVTTVSASSVIANGDVITHWMPLPGLPKKGGALMTRADILQAAEKCVCGQREQDYGSPENNFRLIAQLWELYIRKKCVSDGSDVAIQPEDVAMLMALLKIARICTGAGTTDSFVDLAGYAACAGEIVTGGGGDA